MEYEDASPTLQDEKTLNELGLKGWELVAVTPPTPEQSFSETKRLWMRYYLKRPVE